MVLPMQDPQATARPASESGTSTKSDPPHSLPSAQRSAAIPSQAMCPQARLPQQSKQK